MLAIFFLNQVNRLGLQFNPYSASLIIYSAIYSAIYNASLIIYKSSSVPLTCLVY